MSSAHVYPHIHGHGSKTKASGLRSDVAPRLSLTSMMIAGGGHPAL